MRLDMIVRFYVDVSGHELDQRAVTAAGYLCSDAQYAAFSRKWNAALDLAGADAFHATDFFACQEKFKHLVKGSPRHNELGRLFARTVFDQLPHGCVYSADCNRFDDVLGPVFAKLKTPHDRMPAAMFAVTTICNRAAQRWLSETGPNAARAVAFIEGGTGVGEIIDWLLHLKRIGEPWTQAYREFVPIPKSEYGVQAADFLAYEMWCEAEALLRDPGRKWKDVTREAFKILATGPLMPTPEDATLVKIDTAISNDEQMRRTAPLFVSFIAANPQYRRPPWWHGWRRRLRLAAKALWRNAGAPLRGYYWRARNRLKRSKKC
jgi:hypothetical protein